LVISVFGHDESVMARAAMTRWHWHAGVGVRHGWQTLPIGHYWYIQELPDAIDVLRIAD